MKKTKTRIRYKKLLICLLLAAAVLAAAVYGVLALLAWLRAPAAAPASGAPADSEYYLFIGTSDGGKPQADSLILASVNRAGQSVYAVSLPGHTRISRTGEPLLLLRDAYAEGGAEKTVSPVENLLHIRIGRYAVFDRASFSSLIGHFSGVDLYVEKNMDHADASGTPDIDLRQGFQTLEGEEAYGYLRFIDQEEGEIGRIQREERFFKALLAQGREHLRPYSWALVRYYWSSPDTNITAGEAASIVYDIMGFPADNLHFVILPGEVRAYDGQNVWEINPVEIQKVVGLTIDQ